MADTPPPAPPRWWLWGAALLVFLVAGFMLAVYVLPDAEIQDKSHLLKVACGGPFLVWLLFFGIRLSLYEFTAFRINTRNRMLDSRRRQWQRWANQGVSVLVSTRHLMNRVQTCLSAAPSLPIRTIAWYSAPLKDCLNGSDAVRCSPPC
jgi:hypothetical protein